MQYDKTLTAIISQALLSSVYVALASIIEHMYSQINEPITAISQLCINTSSALA